MVSFFWRRGVYGNHGRARLVATDTDNVIRRCSVGAMGGLCLVCGWYLSQVTVAKTESYIDHFSVSTARCSGLDCANRIEPSANHTEQQ